MRQHKGFLRVHRNARRSCSNWICANSFKLRIFSNRDKERFHGHAFLPLSSPQSMSHLCPLCSHNHEADASCCLVKYESIGYSLCFELMHLIFAVSQVFSSFMKWEYREIVIMTVTMFTQYQNMFDHYLKVSILLVLNPLLNLLTERICS